MKNIVVALGLTGITFLLGSLGYVVISSQLGAAFGGLFRMFMYHEAHPFQYIGIVAVVFGILGAGWVRFFGVTEGWKRWVSILLCIVFTIFVASVPGGILWKIHDMQAGYFTEGARFWRDLWWGAKEGLLVGWFVMLISIPYNLIGIVIGTLLLHKLPSIVSRITKQGRTRCCQQATRRESSFMTTTTSTLKSKGRCR